MGLKKALVLGSITVLLGIGILFLLTTGYLRFNYPSSIEFPVRGIDVSHHQNKIEWQLVKNESIDFVYIKATEGGDFKDDRFITNWNSAKEVGIDVGAYHFFTFCTSGKKQAENFVSTVPKEKNMLPPVIDLEYGGNCTLTISKQELLVQMDRLESALHSFYDKKPVLYVTQEFYNDFLKGNYMDNPIWIRDIYKKPSLEQNRHWTFWQYANRGHIKGIETYVDLNVFNGTRAEYEKFKGN